MKRLFLLSLSLLMPAAAHADRLPPTQRAAFEAQLRSLMYASDLDIDELEAHVSDRLGFGGRVHHPGTLTVAQRRAELAKKIADSLEIADIVRGAIDVEIAGITTIPREPGFPTNPYRHAATTMTDAYSELELVRRRYRDETDLVEKQRLRRLANAITKNLRDTGPTRSIAQLVLSTDPDVGALFGEFWSNHFNVSSTKTTWGVVDYQKAIRRGVCGTFRDLLGTSAKHPAMLVYLDNFRSTANAINENYGRELLELHTLGDDRLRFYTQADVVKAARALTGWGVGFKQLDPKHVRPGFQFFGASHDPAAMTLFSGAPDGIPLTLPAATVVRGVPQQSAVSRGDRLLDYLATHGATRGNVCRKLTRRLFGMLPEGVPAGCVANNVWKTDGDLGSIYRYLLTRPEFWNRSSYQNKFKNPIELIVSTHRRSMTPRAIVDNTFLVQTRAAIASLGFPIADVPPPTGYDDDNGWRSAGALLTYNPYLFAHLNTERLRLDVGGRNLFGQSLENHVRARIAEANAAMNPIAARRALAAELNVELLGFPASAAFTPASVEGTLLLPDTEKGTGEVAAVKSFVEIALGRGNFLKK